MSSRELRSPNQSHFHGMIVVEGQRCTMAAMNAAISAIGFGCYRVTIVAVADPLGVLASLGPMGGASCFTSHLQLCPDELQRQSVARAAIAARDAVAAVPEHIPVQHCVASNWREAVRLAEGCEVLVVAAMPTRLRDRWLLKRNSPLAARRGRASPGAIWIHARSVVTDAPGR